MTQQYGRLPHLVDARQQLSPTYQQLFDRAFKTRSKLTLAQQVQLLRSLHPHTLCAATDKRQGPPSHDGTAPPALAYEVGYPLLAVRRVKMFTNSVTNPVYRLSRTHCASGE